MLLTYIFNTAVFIFSENNLPKRDSYDKSEWVGAVGNLMGEKFAI